VLAVPARAAYPGVNGRVAFDSFIGDFGDALFTMASDGSGATNSGVPGSAPSYSPDGKRLAFVQGTHLEVVNADFSNDPVEVSPDDPDTRPAESPSWSPDGQRIVLGREVGDGGGDIDVVNVATGDETLLLAGVQGAPDPSWSPDGSLIAYSDDGNIWTIGPDGSGKTDLIDPEDVGSYSAPDFSPDGRRIVAGRFESGGEGSFSSTIEVMDANGANRDSLAGADQQALDRPAWSPDGRLIAYEDNTRSSGGTPIDFVAVESKKLQGTSANGFAPSWQPIDDVAPTANLRVPADGARYDQDAQVLSDYICADPPPGSQVVVQCRGTVPAKAPVPTGTPGTHVFTVTARDRMGNQTVVSHAYTVVAHPPPPPVTRILTGPPSRTRSRAATFTFTADRGPVTFSCAVDAGGFGRCSGFGKHVVTRLSLGVHHFRVRARNAGGVDPHPPAWTWKVLPKRLPKRAAVFSTFERHVAPTEFVLFRSVLARHVPAGTRIRATCRGRGCPRLRHRSWFVRKARAKVRLTRWIRHRELRPTAAVFVELTKPGFVGKGKLYCVRHHRHVRIVPYTVGQPRPRCRR